MAGVPPKVIGPSSKRDMVPALFPPKFRNIMHRWPLRKCALLRYQVVQTAALFHTPGSEGELSWATYLQPAQSDREGWEHRRVRSTHTPSSTVCQPSVLSQLRMER